jgi:hypothetical protein
LKNSKKAGFFRKIKSFKNKFYAKIKSFENKSYAKKYSKKKVIIKKTKKAKNKK